MIRPTLTGIALGCLAAGLLLCRPAAATAADPPPDAQLTVIESNEQTIVLELTVTGFAIEQLEQESRTYARVDIAGLQQTTQPGAPQPVAALCSACRQLKGCK